MIDARNNFGGGLNLDDNLFSIPKDSYINALNVTRDAVSSNFDDSLTNIVGNQLRPYSLPPGVNKSIGSFGYKLRMTVLYFVYNQYGKHSILQYSQSTGITTKVFENLTDTDNEDVLGFTEAGKITSVEVFPRDPSEGDLLFFIDSLGRPTTLNIKRFIAGEYTPVTRSIVDLAKRVPLSPPTNVYANDILRIVNNLRGKFFRFAYRWVFDDFEKSTCSPISALTMPLNLLDDEYTNVSTNNNLITVVVNTGPKNVAKIELLMSYAYKTNIWSDFALVESIDKNTLGLVDDADYSYSFYNDATYPYIPIEERILLFDYVPELANALCMPNGNVLMLSGITEGLDKDITPNVDIQILQVEAGEGEQTGTLSAVVNATGSSVSIIFSGVPATGTLITLIMINDTTGLPVDIATYTTVEGDTATIVTTNIALGVQSFGFPYFQSGSQLNFTFNPASWTYNSLLIVGPTVISTDNSIATWPWQNERNIGLVYYNEKGVTPGIMYSEAISFMNYNESGGAALLPYINAKIYHRPPSWAYSYQWAVTKTGFQNLFFECIDVNDTESDYIYFDISNMPLNLQKNPTVANVVTWTFQDGDRMRLIKRVSDDFIYGPSYDIYIEGIVVDPIINNVATTGTFVKIKNIFPFEAEDYSSNFYVIEFYRDLQPQPTAENQVFYEIGVEFPILNPGTDERVHAGEVTDQSENLLTPAEVNIYNGDWFFRVRTVYISETGLSSFYCSDKNIVDSYISGVSTVDGRPLVIDVNARRAYYPATSRHGQAYQANTSVNGLNRFYPNDFIDVDLSFGDIERVAVNDRRVWVFQKFKIGQIPIFSQINREPNGTIVNVVTSQLLNPVDYYAGNWGIGDAATSLVIFNYVAYFCDNINGVVLRLSKDGLTPISVLFNVNSWATDNLPLRTNGYFIYGGYDQQLNNYIISLEAVGSSPAQTLVFSESKNDNERPAFTSFLSLFPENMCSLGVLFISFKEGGLWTHDSETHNSFFGYDYESSVTFVFNETPLQKKSWQNITMIANSIWDCPEISTNVNSYGDTKQNSNLIESEFRVLEGNPSTTFKRDTNSNGGKYNGNFLKGNYIIVKCRKQNARSLQYLNTVSVYFVASPLVKV